MKRAVSVDIETTGLPMRIGFGRYYDPSDLAKYEHSRVVSIAFYNEDWQKEVYHRGFAVPRHNDRNGRKRRDHTE
jgi:hypothetical protein